VAERPQDLGRLWRDGQGSAQLGLLSPIVGSLKNLENDETLLVQSASRWEFFKTHEYAPRVLIANSNLVGHFSNWRSSTNSSVPG